MASTEYEFCELPLVVENGFESGLVNGSAEISYHRDGEWFVGAIWLDGYKANENKLAGFERKSVEIDRNTDLYLSILDQLERGRFKDAIHDKVQAALADDGVVQLSDYRQHNTHCAAYSGIAR